MMHFRIKSNNRPSTTATRFDVSAQFSKISKQNTTPKLYKDKENLQDENIQLKLQLNQTKVELQKSKLVNIQLEVLFSDQQQKELQRFEQIVDDQVKLGDGSTKSNLERQGLVYKLKNKQKQLVQELIDKTKELDHLKRSTKQTYITELEIELQNYQEETIRLRQQLEYVQQIIDLSQQGETIEKKYLQQEKTLQILHKDNTQLNQQLIALENQLKGLKNKLEEQAKIIIQQSNELNQNSQTISELKDYIQQQNQKESKQPLNSQYHMEQIKLENIQIIENLKDQHQEQLDFKIKEIRELNTEIYRLKYKVQELEQLLESEPRHEFMSTPIQFDSIKEERDDVKVRPYVELKQPVSAKKRLPKVQYFEIKPIATRLKINLFKNNKPYEQLDEIFDDLGQDISIYQCKELLSKWPFNLIDRNEVLLISRYLVEDNQDDYVIFDENRNNNAAVVKSIIKKIIGKYTLYQQDEEKQIIAQIKKVNYYSQSKKINSSLNETIQLIVAKKKHLPNGCCEPQDFEQALKFHEIVFTQREQELIDMILFDQSQSLEVVNYNKFLQYFSKQEQE